MVGGAASVVPIWRGRKCELSYMAQPIHLYQIRVMGQTLNSAGTVKSCRMILLPRLNESGEF